MKFLRKVDPCFQLLDMMTGLGHAPDSIDAES